MPSFTTPPAPTATPSRRHLLRMAGALPLLHALPALAQEQANGAKEAKGAAAPGNAARTLHLAGPSAAISFALLRMAQAQPLADWGIQIRFTQWRDPDHLRALTLEKGADFLAAPTNVAANLYNRGVPLQLLNVPVWGILALLSLHEGRRTLADFKGQTIAIPFRADMPDIVFQLLARAQGLDPQKDFALHYVATPMEAAQLLLSGKVENALLAEPVTSLVMHKSQSFPTKLMAKTVHRSVDLQQEWGRVLQRPPQIPQACVVALGQARSDAALLQRFAAAHAQAQAWCYAHPQECGELVAQHIPMLSAPAVADALRHTPARIASAQEARPELEFFYQKLLDSQPSLVGGKLPDDGFYATAAAAEAAS
ncbi:ABC transporter substrate-binding protein [Allofranklinella schreckenbergeri]|uniref:ABC transporter substrate-binding protein n=1 Tax=Allofranklinella schreckenbergeri TaxID=1076744 RepID=A0A3M6R6Z1_9BURK|nr:ABC transporter substrate-binding protein [Allofranklinella schreckenbergeri]RMX11024.1 ABC transporter substrate-binding protein [Allofranklinella schreckenbergeri]